MPLFRTVALLIVSLFANSVVTATPPARGACPKPGLGGQRLLQQFSMRGPDGRYRRLGLHHARCNGGLYLIDGNSLKPLLRINEGWWFDKLQRALLETEGDKIRIRVEARFITGIGPTGARPFSRQFVLRRLDGQWRARLLPEIHLKSAGTRYDCKSVLRARTPGEFKALGLQTRGGAVDVEIDFTRQQFFAVPVTLTSGSARIRDIRVTRKGDDYFLSYRAAYPRIGTTNMKYSLIHVVIPKSAKSFQVKVAKGAMVVEARTGLLDRGGVRRVWQGSCRWPE